MKIINKRVHEMGDERTLRIEIELPLGPDGFYANAADFMLSFMKAMREYEDQNSDNKIARAPFVRKN